MSSENPPNHSAAIDIVQKTGRSPLVKSKNELAASSGRSRDVELFLRASEFERQGQVSEAIKYYEQAFRLNPDVDRVVNMQEANTSRPTGQEGGVVGIRPKFQSRVPGLLEELQAEVLSYEPLDLPAEVMVQVLSWVGIIHAVSLEECAKTCKKLYISSRSPRIWRRMYFLTRVSLERSIPKSLSYRDLYFDTPRLRTDGLYICKLTYFRPGITDCHFYQPIHLVTYYRYLRLFPAEYGYSAILLVTTEEPKTVTNLLRDHPKLDDFIPFGVRSGDLVPPYGGKRKAPSTKLPAFKKANIFVGKYFRNCPDDAKWYFSFYDPQSTHNSLFEMEITLRRRTIVCDRYVSISPPITPNGLPSVYEFNVRDWNKFLFSRVRSYLS